MASWKKVIVSGSAISQLDNDLGYVASAGSGLVSASVFSSPAQGEMTASINGVETKLDLGLQITDSVEFAVVTASIFKGNLEGVADSASFADADDVWFVDGNNQTLTEFSSSIVTTIQANAADALEIIGDNDVLLKIEATETASFVGGEGISTSGTGNTMTIAMSDNYSIAGSGSVGDDMSVGGDLSVTGNATITGDLTVNGTTTTVNTTNLNIEDKFILLSSGSTSGNDAGLVVAGQGASFGWDESANRWAFDFEGATYDQTTITKDAFVAAVVDNDDANYRKNGNIRVQSGEIYIYVE